MVPLVYLSVLPEPWGPLGLRLSYPLALRQFRHGFRTLKLRDHCCENNSEQKTPAPIGNERCARYIGGIAFTGNQGHIPL